MKKTILTVKAGEHDRRYCPVTGVLEENIDASKGLVLKEKATGCEVPCQSEETEGGTRLWWILDNLSAGKEREYEVSEGEPSTCGGVTCVEQEGRIDVTIGGDAFTSYHFGSSWARPFLSPIMGPYGLPMTRRLATPEDEGNKEMDHPHHRSFWVAYGEVNGVDNWSENPGHGKTLHRSFDALTGGPVLAHIRALGDWVSAQGEKLLEERRRLRIYNLPEWCRVVDMEVTLTATEQDVFLGDTKEGGIASVRVMPSMEVRHTGKIENAHGGINEDETWGKQAMWCDYSGWVDGRQVGLTLFDHPDSFRFPTYWHVRDYGLMTANPFGLSHFKEDSNQRGDHTMKQGDSLFFRYRMFLHPGDATEGNVGEKYHDFVNPPVVCAAK